MTWRPTVMPSTGRLSRKGRPDDPFGWSSPNRRGRLWTITFVSLGAASGDYLFPGSRGPDRSLTTRQYARLVSEWVSGRSTVARETSGRRNCFSGTRKLRAQCGTLGYPAVDRQAGSFVVA